MNGAVQLAVVRDRARERVFYAAKWPRKTLGETLRDASFLSPPLLRIGGSCAIKKNKKETNCAIKFKLY